MKWAIPVALAAVLFALPGQSAEKRPDAVRSLAEDHWKGFRGGKDVVQKITWATSAYVAKCFPGTELYHVQLLNPNAARVGPPTLSASIVRRGDEVTFIETEAEAAAYFAKAKFKVKDARGATVVARAFADLCDYQLMRAPPGLAIAKGPASDWSVATEKTKAGWSVTCTLLIDPHAGICRRYRITVSPKGEVSANCGKLVHGLLYE